MISNKYTEIERLSKAFLLGNWYSIDNGVYGTGAKCCKGCSANSYAPDHEIKCKVKQLADLLGVVVSLK